MRKTFLALLLLVFAVGAFALLTTGNRSNAPWSLLFRHDARAVAELGQKFMEDLQFKDFKAAAGLSSPTDREKADIPKLIERLFQLKPEQLDINKIELLSADVDSTGERARTKFGTDVKVLNLNELRHPEIMLYWKKATDGHWYMDIQSSLQN
jgi:hypothetical protein